jgi:hypothetical protein
VVTLLKQNSTANKALREDLRAKAEDLATVKQALATEKDNHRRALSQEMSENRKL